MKRDGLPFLIILAIAAPARATSIVNRELQFHFELPPGFEEFQDQTHAIPNLWRAFRRDSREHPDDFAMIGVAPMTGTIGREPLALGDVSKVAAEQAGKPVDMNLTHWKWREFDLEVITAAPPPGTDIISFAVQVPLTPKAVHILFAGPVAKQKELALLGQSVLATVDGKSNWLSDAERSRKLGMLFGGIGVALFFVFRARRRRSKTR